ncbi:MAG: AEC family transporter [Bacteroidota bacterium]
MIEQFLFSLGVIGPVFLLILLGIIVKVLGIVDQDFVTKSSKFVFKISLPALLINKLASADFGQVFDVEIIYFALITTVIQFGLSWFASMYFTKLPEDRGVFIQGSFRSNYAIVGLAVLSNYFGNGVLGKATLVLAFVMPLYNLLGVVSLVLPHQRIREINFLNILKEIMMNPLVLSVFIAMPFSYGVIEMPVVVDKTILYLSNIALPLALIGIGATLNLESLKAASIMSFTASGIKIVIFPLIFSIIAIYWGFSGADLGILFVLFGSPTAIASFIMADAMKGNRMLAGDIIIISSVLSVLTLSIGFTFLNYYGYI